MATILSDNGQNLMAGNVLTLGRLVHKVQMADSLGGAVQSVTEPDAHVIED